MKKHFSFVCFVLFQCTYWSCFNVDLGRGKLQDQRVCTSMTFIECFIAEAARSLERSLPPTSLLKASALKVING